jgi:hypothetical protein
MADKLVPSRDDSGVIQRYVDQGDGTWALNTVAKAVAAAAGAANYPTGATPVAAASSATAALLSINLPGAVGKTTYITGMEIFGLGATAATVIGAALNGLLGGNMTIFIGVPGSTSAEIVPKVLQFNPPLPANAVNTAISLTIPSFGAGNQGVSASMRGFQL